MNVTFSGNLHCVNISDGGAHLLFLCVVEKSFFCLSLDSNAVHNRLGRELDKVAVSEPCLSAWCRPSSAAGHPVGLELCWCGTLNRNAGP